MEIMSDKFANYKYNLQIRLKNAQKVEHTFEIQFISLRKTLVLRNVKLNIYISGKNRYNSRDFIAKTYRR